VSNLQALLASKKLAANYDALLNKFIVMGWQAKAANMFASNLARWQKDEPLLNRLFATRGY
jgi:hypothetical protein